MSKELESVIFDLYARINALESAYIGYVAANENIVVACQNALNVYELHLEALQDGSSAQPVASFPEMLQMKKESVEHSQAQMEYYRNRMARSEELGC